MQTSCRLAALVLWCLSLAAAGCSGGGGVKYDDPPVAALGGGTSVDVAQFNGTSVYTMVVATPEAKPESNSGPSAMYSYDLTTVALGSPGIVRTAGDFPTREAEKRALAARAQPFVAAAPTSITVGTAWNDVYVSSSGNTVDTTCQYVSTHAFFFVDNRDTAAMAPYLAGYGTAFDSIYEENAGKFGTVNDTDGNGKIIIVFTEELDDVPPFFRSTDKYPKATEASSNEGDILYATTTPEAQGSALEAMLAHELQHMIYFDEHYNRGVTTTYTWLNEALAQAAEYFNGYLDGQNALIAYFLDAHWMGVSLTHWSSNHAYGALFAHYLIGRYGEAITGKLCATERVGIDAVEFATGDDFNELFNDFAQALVLSGSGNYEPRYSFSTIDLKGVQPSGRGGLTTTTTYNAGDPLSGNLYPYRLSFIHWTGDFGTMTLSGDGIRGTVFGLTEGTE